MSRGGQKTAVACIARSNSCKPKVLLLDEALSALDHKVRVQMRTGATITATGDWGFTLSLFTHDQEGSISHGNQITNPNDGRFSKKWDPR